MISEIIKHYFAAFSDQNLSNLEQILDNDVVLKDWEVGLVGKASVLEHNRKFFASVEKISIVLLELTTAGNNAFCEIDISIDESSPLRVLDVIYFNKNMLITKINAFKQF